jgi:EAL domain-containing protein (putative c-di-GMP-specific phosphodiesterase class I)
MDTVAEGVETIEQLSELRRMGCLFAQGYLLGRPKCSDEGAAGLSLLAPDRLISLS